MTYADASPDKRFFIDLITRDISLEDAILDLIDNSVDSLIRTVNLDLYRDLLTTDAPNHDRLIKISLTRDKFCIEDNCGGISYERAKSDVFRFGLSDPKVEGSLSVFGIGMKRALFKIGRMIQIQSSALGSGFRMIFNVNDWLRETKGPWRIPLEETKGTDQKAKAGTKIVITEIRKEVAILVQNPVFHNKLFSAIQKAYPFYLDRHALVTLNGIHVSGEDLSFGKSDRITPSVDTWQDGSVKASLICGLLPRDKDSWTAEKSGWYVLCNGRVIIHADRTELTGWGTVLPQFVPKYRGFLGIVFYVSDNPEDLPWKTTKRDVNTESPVYIRTMKRMVAVSRLVIQFQNKMYKSRDMDEPREEYRDSMKELTTSSATRHAAEMGTTTNLMTPQAFKYVAPRSTPKFSNIQFQVKIEELDQVKKRLGRPNMSNREAGEKVFAYYLDRECST